MFRVLITTFYVLGLFLFESILQEPVSVKISAPLEVTAGDEFQVQVTLNKHDLSGFSRFMQDLPAGLTASPVQSANADFTFDEKKIRLIWLKLPSEDEIVFSYKVKVDQRLKGNFRVGGLFSYIESNERKSIPANPLNITIHQSPNIDPSLVVDIKDFEKSVIPDLRPKEFNQIMAVRQEPVYDREKNEILIHLLVNKNDQQKFAKIEEVIPSGYTALNVEGRSAIFTFRDNTVKYLWMNLPPEPYFVVTYKLIPGPDVRPGDLQITGNFSYIVDDKTQLTPVANTSRNLTDVDDAKIGLILASVGEGGTAFDDSKSSGDNSKLIAANNKETEKKKNDTAKKNQSSKKKSARSVTDRKFLLEPQDGVYYRVQIAAGKKPVNIKKYFRKLPFTEDVRTEFHEGWYKYSTGSFREYREARDYRVHIWNTTRIDDAFVSAYNSGNRITVQEALMIANQRWYK